MQYNPDGSAVQCTKCLREVVGAHYQNEEPGFPTVVLCMSCCWDEQILQAAGGDDSASAMQLRMPQPGQRLLGGGEEEGSHGGSWPWLDAPGRRGSRAAGGAGSTSSGSESSGEDVSEASGGSRQHPQQLRLQQQMEAQVHSAGGLLAAVARRLDGMAAAAEPGVGGSSGSSGEVARARFEQTLLALVAQAQKLLRYVTG